MKVTKLSLRSHSWTTTRAAVNTRHEAALVPSCPEAGTLEGRGLFATVRVYQGNQRHGLLLANLPHC